MQSRLLLLLLLLAVVSLEAGVAVVEVEHTLKMVPKDAEEMRVDVARTANTTADGPVSGMDSGRTQMGAAATDAAGLKVDTTTAEMNTRREEEVGAKMARNYSAAGRNIDMIVPRRYDNHVVLKVVPTNKQQVDTLMAYFKNGEVDVWQHPHGVGDDVQFRVAPAELNWTKSFLDEEKFNYEAVITDVQKIIDSQSLQMKELPGSLDWISYHRLGTIYEWLESLPKRFPGVVTLVQGGMSSEGRHILGVRIAHSPGLPVFYVEGGMHGREWVSPAATTYVLKHILESQDPNVARLARSFEWHFFPSVNPDSYEYSHTTDRLWRKSRRRTSFRCYGADINRNFPYNWGTVGVSWDFCSETFPGTRAASEIETRTRIAYIEELLPRMRAFVAIHSFGQYLLFPWGHTSSPSKYYTSLFEVASRSAESFAKRHGTQLRVGSLHDALYPAAGCSMDWAHSRGVPFSYTFELRDRGLHGFLLPADQIVPAAEELWDGFVTMAEEIRG